MIISHGRRLLALLPAALCLACSIDEQLHPTFRLETPTGWTQWGRSADHVGSVDVTGQHLARTLASFVYDPFVDGERSDSGGHLLIHYQSPLVDGPDVFMEAKTGHYTACPPLPSDGSPPPAGPPCGNDSWKQEQWNEKRYSWENGALVEKWTFQSDWQPPPTNWEPVFHAALAGPYLVIPGAGG